MKPEQIIQKLAERIEGRLQEDWLLSSKANRSRVKSSIKAELQPLADLIRAAEKCAWTLGSNRFKAQKDLRVALEKLAGEQKMKQQTGKAGRKSTKANGTTALAVTLGVSRQRACQIMRKADGKCITCGKEAASRDYCLEHAEKQRGYSREGQRRRRKAVRP